MRESPSREIYLCLDEVGARRGEYMIAVRWLRESFGLRASRVDAYYDATYDRALLKLGFDHLSSWELSALVVWAHCENLRFMEPDTCTPERYRHFYVEYLPRFRLVAEDCGRIDFALVAVAQTRSAAWPGANELAAGASPKDRPAAIEGELAP